MVRVRRNSNKPELWAPARTLFEDQVTVVSQTVLDEATKLLGIDDQNVTARFCETVQIAARRYQVLRNDLIERPPRSFYRTKEKRLGRAASTLLDLLRQDLPLNRLVFESMGTMGRPLRSIHGAEPESFEQILEKFVDMCGRRPSRSRPGPQEHVHIRELCLDLVEAIESAVNRKFKRNLNAPGGIFKSTDPRALQLLTVGVDPEISSGQISTALKARGQRKKCRTPHNK